MIFFIGYQQKIEFINTINMETQKALDIIEFWAEYCDLMIDGIKYTYDNCRTHPADTIEFVLLCDEDGINHIYYFHQNTIYETDLGYVNRNNVTVSSYIKSIPNYEENLMKNVQSTVMQVKQMFIMYEYFEDYRDKIMAAINVD